MAHDDEDDLFVEDFDFLDEDEEGSPTEEGAQQEPAETAEEAKEEPKDSAPAKPKRRSSSRGGKRSAKQKSEPEAQEAAQPKETAEEKDTEEKDAEEKEATPEEPKEPPVPTDHVVHIYELRKFKRTINREFTSEDAEAFAVEYNRTSGAHSRQGVASGRDDKPAEAL